MKQITVGLYWMLGIWVTVQIGVMMFDPQGLRIRVNGVAYQVRIGALP